VYIGRCDEAPKCDPQEIQAWRWVSPETLQRELAGGEAERFTPWFRLEWERIWRDHRADILALT
jgi:isopentenyl-diphosphate delta-isomerase